jgi:hypothetical protein
MAIDFELSGLGPSAAQDISLADIQEAAVECGFTKPGVAASKTNAQRANLTAFFKALGVTCVSGFKKRFHAEKLPLPRHEPPHHGEGASRALSLATRKGGVLARRLEGLEALETVDASTVTKEEADAFPETNENVSLSIIKTGQTERGEDHVVRPRRLRVRRAVFFVGG